MSLVSPGGEFLLNSLFELLLEDLIFRSLLILCVELGPIVHFLLLIINIKVMKKLLCCC